MIRQVDYSAGHGGGSGAGASAAAYHASHAIQPLNRPVVPIVSQPLSKPVKLPPQYRPRKPRKQVNVACQPCRKRRSKCTGTAPCSRCEAEGNECVFDGRKDAQERNRELRNAEKALSKVFRVLKKLEGGDSTSTAAFAQIRQLAQNTTEFSAFARDLFNLDDKTNTSFDFADYDDPGSIVPKLENDAQDSTSWSNISPAHTGGYILQPQSSNTARQSPPEIQTNGTALTHSRKMSSCPNKHAGQASVGFISDFGNLPFSSAIKANGYPAHIQHQQLQNLSTSAEYSMLPLHSNEHDALLGKAYLSFRDATLQMIADGMNARDVLGSPDYVNLDLFFRDRVPTDGHSVDTFVCEILKSLANPDLYAKLATVVLLGPLMRWILFPTSEHYRRIPALMRPLPSQRFIPHSPALDLAPHPAIRGVLMSAFNTEWLTPENQITAAPIVNWPYQLDKAVCHDPVAGCLRFTKQFEDHVCEPTNWTFSKRALEVFPTIGEHGAIFALRPGEE
ncbi:hypothetical protein M436DRAFT_50040 [Aureobasidium namibiae CBS 147.97]|uniref:Zn(2)-C6 fungal-type domain-containing protein n=1 Tax=Aureobasidium namibiae CBS 147.97 TaxID=1043004 RepID=A0A074WPL5_9PEZI